MSIDPQNNVSPPPLSERVTSEFNRRFLMNDFVFPSPKFNDRGIKKEVADLLIVLGQECVVLSIKGTDGKEKEESRFHNWLIKKDRKSRKQLRGAFKTLKEREIVAYDGWGDIKIFAAGELNILCGISLLETTQSPFTPIALDFKSKDLEPIIHSISLNDFLNLVMHLGSIKDLFEYLRIRSNFDCKIAGINMEIGPLICFFSHEKGGDFDPLIPTSVYKKEYHEYMERHLYDHHLRQKRADVINEMVHRLHNRAENLEEYFPEEFKSYLEPINDRKAYKEMATLLNSLPMSVKAGLGERVLKAIKDLEETENCITHTDDLGSDHPLLHIAICGNKGITRTNRIHFLHSSLIMKMHQKNRRDALGVAVSCVFSEGFDFSLVRNLNFSTEINELAKQHLPPFEIMGTDSFGRVLF